jgi:hypothetical protein
MDLFGNDNTQKTFDRGVMTNGLVNALSNISLKDFVLLITNEVNEIVEYMRLCNGENACQKTSLLFNPHRLDTATRKSESIYSSLKDERFLNGLARALCFKYGKVKELLYQTIQLGVNGKQYVNEFPPYVAQQVCKRFGVSKNSHVLDACGGWGGRMIGVSTVCDNYTCFEPSTRTYEGLLKLERFIKSMNADFNADIHCCPFEDAVVEKESFDFALTSPPYYDTEVYSDEPTNSINRYASFDAWCDGFYLPMIQKVLDSLKYGSVFLLNIGSRSWPLNDVLLENFGHKYIVEKTKNYLSGTAGMGKDGKEGEAFYIIRK